MRLFPILAAFCVIPIFALASGTKVKGYAVTFHLEGGEEESEKFVTPVKLGSEHRQYYFRKMPEFNDNDIAWFYPFIAQDGASFGAAFRLKDSSAEELNGVTIANQGKLFGTRVLDAPLQAVIIDRPINDGTVVIWEGLSKDHLKLINEKIPHVDQLRGQTEIPQFELPHESGEESPRRGPLKFFGRSKKDGE